MTRRHFPCQPESVTAARRFVRDVLSGRPSEVIEAAELMTSELATNCVRHARTDFELSISANDEIRIQVRDTGGGRPTVLSPAAEEPSGRGLRIVDALADEWGIAPGSDGKTVWFAIAERDALGELARGKSRRRSAPAGKSASPRPPLMSFFWRSLALGRLRRG